MECRASVVWDGGYLAYNFGNHPMNPIRLDFTMALARELGVLDHVALVPPVSATSDDLLTVHDVDYLRAVAAAGTDPGFRGYGLGTDDDPTFAGMYEASALIAGGSQVAADQVWSGAVAHSVNIAGGLHHAQRRAASGFCVFNDVVLAINRLLDQGARRVAYIDIDVHHGDGVQAAFYTDPRVLTVSLHQDPRTLFPGTGAATEVGDGAGHGTAVNVALPPGTDDAGWLRAFMAVVPAVVRAFAPDVLVSQCGCDTHHEDPLAELRLTIDGQRAAIRAMHRLAHECASSRWVALGGGGYGVTRCVPRTWTNLIAEASGHPLNPSTALPGAWIRYVRSRGVVTALPDRMGEQGSADYDVWQPGGESWLDRSILATRLSSYPLFGLDPFDPRD